jgi:hypothetical protein
MIVQYPLMPLARFVIRAAVVLGATVFPDTAILRGEKVTEAGAGAPVESTALMTSPDYFGAKPPGVNVEIFAPGIVSLSDRFEARIAFSPDLQECYLTETDATFSHPKMLEAHRTKNGWSTFSPVSFGAKFKFCHEPFLSADNRRLYFTADGEETIAGNLRDFWVTERAGSGWSEPSRLPAPINSDAIEFFLSQSGDGTMVFASNRQGGQGHFDLYHMEKAADCTVCAVNFGASINTPGPEFDPCISPDGRILIFASARNGANNLDLYITFQDDNKTWIPPVALKGNANTGANEYAPVFSPDGRYLFFVRHDGKQSDVYWMAASSLNPHNYLPDGK